MITNLLFIIRDYYDRIKKIIHWVPILWNDWDSEGSHLWLIMYYKLQSMRRFFRYEIDLPEEEIKPIESSLTAAILIVDRLAHNQYENKHLETLYDKWGTPTFDTATSMVFPKVKTEADKKQFLKDQGKVERQMIKDRSMDIKKLADILDNDLPIWDH